MEGNMPDGYLRSLMGEGERVLLITRQHWFVVFKAVIAEILLALAILALVIIGRLTVIQNDMLYLALILLLLPVIGLGWDVLTWSKRQYVITNRRVIQISGVYNKNVIDSSLEKVNDVKLTQSFFGRMFNFGDVEILTASELGVNMFRMINEPIKYKIAMIDAKGELERVPGSSWSGDEDIPTLISKLDELRKRGLLTEMEFQQKKAQLLAKM
jgi:hypothetical protein